MLHKIIRLEGADVLWDLWDSTPKHEGSRLGRRGSRTALTGASTSDSDGDSLRESARIGRAFNEVEEGEPEAPIPGPTEENIVASAKLLTLPGDEHTARVSVRCPLFALAAQSTIGETGNCADDTSPDPNPSSSAPDPWSSFELRVHLDVGSIVACACPSQFYWLQLTVGQLNHIWQMYQNITLTRTTSPLPENNPTDGTYRSTGVVNPSDARWFPASNQVCLFSHFCLVPVSQ
ncbi:unnamed protein product [Echinostoma caproni]|uniref:Uncharacterized protein n=1 Tax=Echinostoma caproni TaxID=27848 RepID=A0A183B6V4_9TREM|nr:unnamed protein product [Echinostoma caproni]